MPRFDAFGRELIVERRDDAWVVFDRGSEGKRRRARDVVIPADIQATELAQFLDDLLHEHARPGHMAVRLLSDD